MKRSTVSSVILLAAWSIFGSAAPSTAAQAGNTTCLDAARGEVSVGWPCIHGTYDIYQDVTETESVEHTRHEVGTLHVEFELWATRPGQLQGNAHLSYSFQATLLDTSAKGCKVQAGVAAPFEWNVAVAGRYFKQPDKSVQIMLEASPARGPSFVLKIKDCPVPDQQQPGVTWAALPGRLWDGWYDASDTIPLPPNSTGEYYWVAHMEIVEGESSPRKSPAGPDDRTRGTGCLDSTSEVVAGEPCIRGTYLDQVNVITQTGPDRSDRVASILSGSVSLWAVGMGRLQGTAHLTYGITEVVADAKAARCGTRSAVVKPFSWDVALQGRYSKTADGGILVDVKAMPAEGPPFTEVFSGCPTPARQMPGVGWAGVNATLVKGTYDYQQGRPLPPDSTGQSRVAIHLELSKKPKAE